MTEFIHQFHFLRPGWLLALLPILLMTGWMVRRTLTQSRWSDHIDPHLQGYMLDSQPGQASQLLNGLVTASLMIAVIALAGPTWERKPVPVIANPNALVLLMDMSLSMKAQDMAPDRAVRAIRKATDIVRGREDGVTAVIAYAGDAHTVVPFTDDQATIEHLISSLSPEIMPKPGSRPDRAVSKAATLMQDAGINQADFLLITDGIRQRDIARITTALPANTCVHSIAVGTPEGAPIPLGDQGFIKNASGTIVLPKLDTQPLQALADDIGCRWQPIRYDDRDWQTLLNTAPDLTADHNSGQENDQENQEKRTLEIWADAGIWLTWLLIPVSLLMFRRGTLFILCLGIGISLPAPASPWQTGDQEGAQWFAQDPAKAATLFDDTQWQGSAHYRNGNYEAAAQAFAQNDTPAAHYNRGNALAMQGELEQAIAAYEAALSQQPDFPEAQENLDALKAMQEQQSQQDSSDGSDSSENSDKSENSDQPEGSDQSDGSEDNAEQSGNSGESQPNDSNSSSDSNSNSSSNNTQNGSRQDSGSPDSASQSNSDASQSDDDQRRSDDEYAEQMAQQPSADAQQSESQRAAQDSSKESSDKGSDDDSQSITAQQESTESSESESGKQAIPPQTPQKDAGNDWPENMSREQQAVMESLMNEVDDNPGLLMQRKFLLQYRQSADQTEEDVLW